MKNPRRFYVYVYVRENGVPYYVGRGTGSRAYKHSKRDACPAPLDKSLVKILAVNLTTEEANEWESDLIEILGRESLGTGCLVNKRDGGESMRNMVYPEDFADRISAAMTGLPKSEAHKKAISEARKGVQISEQTAEKISDANSVPKRWFHPEHGTIVLGGKQLAKRYLPHIKLSTASGYLSRIASGQISSAHGWTCLDAPTRPIYEYLPEVLVFISPDGRQYKGTASEVGRITGINRKALRKLANGTKPRKDSHVFGWSIAE